jgi:hypothetical protein
MTPKVCRLARSVLMELTEQTLNARSRLLEGLIQILVRPIQESRNIDLTGRLASFDNSMLLQIRLPIS